MYMNEVCNITELPSTNLRIDVDNQLVRSWGITPFQFGTWLPLWWREKCIPRQEDYNNRKGFIWTKNQMKCWMINEKRKLKNHVWYSDSNISLVTSSTFLEVFRSNQLFNEFDWLIDFSEEPFSGCWRCTIDEMRLLTNTSSFDSWATAQFDSMSKSRTNQSNYIHSVSLNRNHSSTLPLSSSQFGF